MGRHMTFQKYHGAGNDFLLADGREMTTPMDVGMIRRLCDRHVGFGADGLILVQRSSVADFSMTYYNSDGSTGMMCGNGGRCVAAFANSLGIGGRTVSFEAADCIHEAEILGHEGDSYLIRLSMSDVASVRKLVDDEFFLDTGTLHYVRFVPQVSAFDVVGEGRRVRNSAMFAPSGTNADFVSDEGDALSVRTYEKGVEDETLACGTGIVASALAAHLHRGSDMDGNPHVISVKASIANLRVEFTPHAEGSFSGIWLTGPVEYVGYVATSGGFFASCNLYEH